MKGGGGGSILVKNSMTSFMNGPSVCVCVGGEGGSCGWRCTH